MPPAVLLSSQLSNTYVVVGVQTPTTVYSQLLTLLVGIIALGDWCFGFQLRVYSESFGVATWTPPISIPTKERAK